LSRFQCNTGLARDEPRPEQVRELLQIARRRHFDRNEVVFHRDDPADSLRLIQKGPLQRTRRTVEPGQDGLG
jgi:CRP-like cAMP-binding protein